MDTKVSFRGELDLKKFNLSKLIIIALIIVIAALTAIVISAKNYKTDQKPAAMTQVINDGLGGIDQIIGAPIRFVQDKANQIGDLFDTYKQNESLKKQIAELTEDKNKLSGAEDENKALKEALKLQETLTDFQKVSANVITRNPATWDDTLTIDRGAKDGLKDNMVVVSNGGIVGRVSQVNQTTSKISLLSSTKGIESKIPVRLSADGKSIYGILSGYDAKKEAYIISSVVTKDKISTGSQVFTSGLGEESLSPANLLVGTVVGEETNSQDLNRQIYVKPAGSFYDIHFVFVIQRAVGGN